MNKNSTGIIGNGYYDLNNTDVRCKECGDLLMNSQVARNTKYCSKSCSNKAMWRNPEHSKKVHTEYAKQVQRDRMTKYNIDNWSDPEKSQELCQKFKDAWTDERRKELSEVNKINWNNPEYRGKMTSICIDTLRDFENTIKSHKVLHYLGIRTLIRIYVYTLLILNLQMI